MRTKFKEFKSNIFNAPVGKRTHEEHTRATKKALKYRWDKMRLLESITYKPMELKYENFDKEIAN